MGLDMYLYRKTYVQRWDHQDEDKKFKVTVTRGGISVPGIESDNVAYVIEQCAYWRKANSIHAWFVANVQNEVDDCGTYEVSLEQLIELNTNVKRILTANGRHQRTLIESLLPPQGGFFFGNTDVDQEDGLKWYLADMEETHRQLTPLIEQLTVDKDSGTGLWPGISYQSSW